MEEKLARLEEQMKKLIADFRDVCEKSEDFRLQNEQLHGELLEKSRKLDVLEERGMVLMESQAEKKRMEQQHERIRKEVKKLLKKVRALKDNREQ
jgi:hypothetical protein